MVVDVHCHAWQYPDHFSDQYQAEVRRARAGAEVDLRVRYDHYLANAPHDVRAIVFGGKARLSGVWIPDEHVAEYVARDSQRLIAFMSLDPTQPGWQDEMRHGREVLGMRGIKLLPMYAGFRPDEPRLEPLWDYAERHGLPVLLHTGTTFISNAPLECTLPRHLDPVAIRHPKLRLILAHLGHPYEGECIVVARKHANVYADISALFYRPFQLYNSLMLVQEYGVWDKVLFGTDYPFTTVNDTIAGVRALNGMVEGTALPRLNEDKIEHLIHRDTLPLLGLA
jgi:predicted TIM-barrel fold metal-dependent hydrolase